MKADKILQYANDMHRMVMLLAEHDNQLKDYGNGQFATTVEAHFILTIHEHPGIMITELARYWGRTKGMDSCIVGKLETRGLIEKRKTPDNKKSIKLYLTEKGEIFHQQHMEYDLLEMQKLFSRVELGCSGEEIEAFFKVTEYLTNSYLTQKYGE